MEWLKTMGITGAATLGTTFLLTVGFGAILLPILRYFKCGQPFLKEGPDHAKKRGTPTMGGLCFILAILLSVAGYAIYCGVNGAGRQLIPLALSVGYAFGNAAIGFIDDYRKLIKKRNDGGLTEKQKLVLQMVWAAAYIAMMRITGHLETSLRIPFTDFRLELSWFAYVVYLLVLVGFVNATNLTDGLDGLASSICATVAVFMILFSFLTGTYDVCVLSCALLGGMFGFLVYNHHPAKMFMGDTGSLFLGAMIMGGAMMAGELLLFVLAGFVFVIDMLTSPMQKYYYRYTHGKRLFRMAPVHHHFEKCGWKEGQIVALFAGVSALFCFLAWLGM